MKSKNKKKNGRPTEPEAITSGVETSFEKTTVPSTMENKENYDDGKDLAHEVISDNINCLESTSSQKDGYTSNVHIKSGSDISDNITGNYTTEKISRSLLEEPPHELSRANPSVKSVVSSVDRRISDETTAVIEVAFVDRVKKMQQIRSPTLFESPLAAAVMKRRGGLTEEIPTLATDSRNKNKTNLNPPLRSWSELVAWIIHLIYFLPKLFWGIISLYISVFFSLFRAKITDAHNLCLEIMDIKKLFFYAVSVLAAAGSWIISQCTKIKQKASMILS